MFMLPGCACCFSCNLPEFSGVEISLAIEGGYYAMKYEATLNPAFFGGGTRTSGVAIYVPDFSATVSLTGQYIGYTYYPYAYTNGDITVIMSLNAYDYTGTLTAFDRLDRLFVLVHPRIAQKDSADPFAESVMEASDWASQVTTAGGTVCNWTYGPITLNRWCVKSESSVRYELQFGGSPTSEYCARLVAYYTGAGDSRSFIGDCALPVEGVVYPQYRIEYFGADSIAILSSNLPEVQVISGIDHYSFPITATVSAVTLTDGGSGNQLFDDITIQTCDVT